MTYSSFSIYRFTLVIKLHHQGETINRKGQRNDFYRTKNCVYPWLDYKTVRGKIAIQEEKVSLRK